MKLELVILKSMCVYPSDVLEFLKQVPRESFSKEARVILEHICELEAKHILSLESVDIAISESFKNSDFYIDFLNAKANINYLSLKSIFLQEYALNTQKRIGETLLNAAQRNELLDIDMLRAKYATPTQEFKNLSQWKSFYESQPQLLAFKTHIPFLDSCFFGGIEVGQLVLISGDPEAGKTMLGTQIIENIAKSHKVGFFCFEFTIKNYLKARSGSNINLDNIISINDGYNINDIAHNIKELYKTQGIRVFLIDSQMRITSPQGRNMEEEESAKFTTLAKLCHSLDLLIFLIVQTSKGDRDNPMGSKKGGHEASIIMRLEHCKAKDENLREFSENERMFIVKKNKQNGKHFKEKVMFNHATLSFTSLNREVSQDAQILNMEDIEHLLQDS